MFSQLWHTGRSSRVEMAGGQMPVSASVNPSYWADASHHAAGYALRGSHRLLGRASLKVYVAINRAAVGIGVFGNRLVRLTASTGRMETADPFLVLAFFRCRKRATIHPLWRCRCYRSSPDARTR